MANDFREVPRPNYDYDVKRLTREYEKALRAVQAELNTLFLTDFERAQIVAVEKNIKAILRDLNKYGADWAQVALTKSATEGVASTIYALHLTETYEEALKIARFNSLNKPLVQAIIADTQADLLAVTQNVERKTRAAVRQVTADVMREKATAGINGTQSLQQAITKGLRDKLGSAADTAIVDAAGRRWRVKNYVEVIAKTKTMEVHLEASRNEAISEGVEYGVVSRHYGTCPKCSPWEGRVITLGSAGTGGFPTMEEARAGGLWHPSCRHVLTALRSPDRLPDDLRELNNIG